jgi:hypothetical protein
VQRLLTVNASVQNQQQTEATNAQVCVHIIPMAEFARKSVQYVLIVGTLHLDTTLHAKLGTSSTVVYAGGSKKGFARVVVLNTTDLDGLQGGLAEILGRGKNKT